MDMNPLSNRPLSTPPEQSPGQAPFDAEVDVLIIGSGAAGLAASLRTHFHGLKPLVVEKNGKIGGSSAYSGGALWIPQSSLAKEEGIRDSKDEALKYMERLTGNVVGPASTRQRKLAYLEQGPLMVEFLGNLGFSWRLSKGCPDYYPQMPGALPRFGRTIEPGVFDLNRLNQWQTLLRARPFPASPVYIDEVSTLTAMGSSAKNFARGLKIMCRVVWLKAVGQAPATLGPSLVGQLLHLNQQLHLPIQRNTSLVDIIQRDGTVLGATVQQNNQMQSIRARRGVLLCAGGFAHNQSMRAKYGPAPASTQWTSTPEGDTGDAIQAGMKLGAAAALMDDAWWGPTIPDPVMGKNLFALHERSRPFSIIVDSTGSRFMNESACYTDCGRQQYARNRQVNAIPAWLILDANHRKRYSLGTLPPKQEPKVGLREGYLYRSETLGELAAKIGVDPSKLQSTVARFNVMAKHGVDDDFGRGNNEFDNYFGDCHVAPNPNLGPIAVPPYYAVRVLPGDLGTTGGLVTDEHARVLRADGSVIKGLYATGNASASVMGTAYPGAGSTLGPALTFGYIAVNHMAGASRE